MCACGIESQTLTADICGKVRIYLQGAKQGEWATYAQKTQTPRCFSGKVFKLGIRGKGHRMCDQLLDFVLTGWC